MSHTDKTLVLHVGGPKTGSSAIQRQLALDTERLGRLGITSVSSTGTGWVWGEEAARRAAFSPHGYINGGSQLQRLIAGDKGAGDSLVKALARLEADTIILSDESLASFRAIGEFDRQGILSRWTGRVRVILYVRPHISWLQSAWVQRPVGRSRKLSPVEWMEKSLAQGAPSWSDVAAGWSDLVLDGEVRVRLADTLAGRDSAHDFYQQCAIPSPPESIQVNKRVPAALAKTFRDYPKLTVGDTSQSAREFLLESIAPVSYGSLPREEVPLSMEEQVAVLSMVRKDVDSLEGLLGSDTGEFALDLRWRFPSQLAPARQVDVSSDMVALLTEAVSNLALDVRRLGVQAPTRIRIDEQPSIEESSAVDFDLSTKVAKVAQQISAEFIDFGCSTGNSMAMARRRLLLGAGLGLDIDPVRIEVAKSLGLKAAVADVTKLRFTSPIVPVVLVIDVLQHMPDSDASEALLVTACEAAKDVAIFRQPWFDSESYLASMGFKIYWGDWPEHRGPLSLSAMGNVMQGLVSAEKISGFEIWGTRRIRTSGDDMILPSDTAAGQSRYDPTSHPAKAAVCFLDPVYRHLTCIAFIDSTRHHESAIRTWLADSELLLSSDAVVTDDPQVGAQGNHALHR